MTTVTKLAALSAALAAIGGMIFYFVSSSGGSEPTYPDGPQVEGRLLQVSVGGFGTEFGTIHGFCEYDAQVIAEGDLVLKIIREGERSEVAAGDTLAEDIDAGLYDLDPDDYLPEFDLEAAIAERQPLPSARDVYVYVDEDGDLQTGCAPESWTVIDGVGKTVADWRAEGVLE